MIVCAMPRHGHFRQSNIEFSDWSILQNVRCSGLLWYMFPFHCLRTKSAKTTAAQRAQHIQKKSEPLHLKQCILEEGAYYTFRNEESQKQIPQKCAALAVGLTTVIWMYNRIYDLIQMPKHSHLPIIIFVSFHALQIVYHMLSWGSFFHLLWWTAEVSNFISVACSDELYFYTSLPIQTTLQCREIIQFYLIINNYSQLLFFQLID